MMLVGAEAGQLGVVEAEELAEHLVVVLAERRRRRRGSTGWSLLANRHAPAGSRRLAGDRMVLGLEEAAVQELRVVRDVARVDDVPRGHARVGERVGELGRVLSRWSTR